MAQIVADQRKVGFFRFDIFDLGYPLNCLGLVNVAANGIYSIGGVDDHTSLSQAIHCKAKQPFTGIFGMDPDKHAIVIDGWYAAKVHLIAIIAPVFLQTIAG